MQEADLKELGLAVGHRRKVMTLLAKLKQAGPGVQTLVAIGTDMQELAGQCRATSVAVIAEMQQQVCCGQPWVYQFPGVAVASTMWGGVGPLHCSWSCPRRACAPELHELLGQYFNTIIVGAQ